MSYDDQYAATNTEGRYYKLYVTTVFRPKKGPPVFGSSNLIWFTAKGAAELAYKQLTDHEYLVTKLYRS